MENHTINAEARPGTGKGVARKLRADGKVPAVAYGLGGEAVGLAIPAKQFALLKKASRGWNTPVTIAVEGGEDIPLAVLKDVQRHPLSGKLLHADFVRVVPGAEVTVRVRVVTVGKAPGTELGGSLQTPMREIDIICAPENVPAVIEVDVSELNINDKVLLHTMTLPEGLRVASKHNLPVVSCVGKRGGGIDDEDETEDEESEEGEEEAEE